MKIVGAAVIGGYSIDLSSATDQVISFAGSANSGIAQTGFANVDVSGTTGNYGADITGRSTAASSIIGTANADNVVAGSGSDTITGGSGNDIINVGSGTDTIRYSARGQTHLQVTVGTAIASGDVLTGIDQITGMARGDLIDLSSIASSSGVSTATGFNLSIRTTGLSGATGQDFFQFSRGIFTSTGLWTYSSTGPDVLLQWDANVGQVSAAANTQDIESVILVGSGGTFTGLTANTAGVLLYT